MRGAKQFEKRSGKRTSRSSRRNRKRVPAAKRLHAAQVRRQQEFLRSIGVSDLSPEEVTEKARRRAQGSATT